jgi:hypothetical protein
MSVKTQNSDEGIKTPSIINFSEGRNLQDPRLALNEAAAFIFARKRSKDKHIAQTLRLTIEEGLAYEWTFTVCGEQGIAWEKWVEENTPYSSDTAKNYRNVAEKFLTLVETTEEDVLERLELGALYKMAVRDVTDIQREWFFNFMLESGDTTGDTRLAAIARFELIAHADAGDNIRKRLEEKVINIDQAYSLCVSLPKCSELIQGVSISLGVKYGQVSEALNRVFLDYCRTPNEQRADKTWAEIVKNQYHLLWYMKDNREKRVYLGDATPSDFELYMGWRSYMHQLENPNTDEVTRATATATRKNGKIILELMDSTTLNLEEGETITIPIELILSQIKTAS